MFAGKKSAQIREILINESAWEEMTCLFAPSLAQESQIKVLTFAAWIIGAAVGFMTVKGLFTLTTIPSVDSILVACIAYAILSRASQHR